MSTDIGKWAETKILYCQPESPQHGQCLRAPQSETSLHRHPPRYTKYLTSSVSQDHSTLGSIRRIMITIYSRAREGEYTCQVLPYTSPFSERSLPCSQCCPCYPTTASFEWAKQVVHPAPSTGNTRTYAGRTRLSSTVIVLAH